MSKITGGRNWAAKVVVAQRGCNGRLFYRRAEATFETEREAIEYARILAPKLTNAGTFSMAKTRGGRPLAEFRGSAD